MIKKCLKSAIFHKVAYKLGFFYFQPQIFILRHFWPKKMKNEKWGLFLKKIFLKDQNFGIKKDVEVWFVAFCSSDVALTWNLKINRPERVRIWNQFQKPIFSQFQWLPHCAILEVKFSTLWENITKGHIYNANKK